MNFGIQSYRLPDSTKTNEYTAFLEDSNSNPAEASYSWAQLPDLRCLPTVDNDGASDRTIALNPAKNAVQGKDHAFHHIRADPPYIRDSESEYESIDEASSVYKYKSSNGGAREAYGRQQAKRIRKVGLKLLDRRGDPLIVDLLEAAVDLFKPVEDRLPGLDVLSKEIEILSQFSAKRSMRRREKSNFNLSTYIRLKSPEISHYLPNNCLYTTNGHREVDKALSRRNAIARYLYKKSRRSKAPRVRYINKQLAVQGVSRVKGRFHGKNEKKRHTEVMHSNKRSTGRGFVEC